jgi:pimeloyl-ACP methyl ester carboxylesterase
MQLRSGSSQKDGLADGLSVRVADGGGPAILWLHGYSLDSSIWTVLWEHLPGWRHIGVDLPGHGGSAALKPGETLPELAQRVGDFALREGVEHIAAISLGAMIALQIGIEYPEAFRSLSLCSPPVGGGPHEPLTRMRNSELQRLHEERGPGPWMTELWMSSPPDIFRGAAGHPTLWASLQTVINRHTWAELAGSDMQHLAMYSAQLKQLTRIRAVTLVVVGENDMPAFRRCGELLRRNIPRCERVYWPDAGHLAFLEFPGAVSPVLKEHWLRAAS